MIAVIGDIHGCYYTLYELVERIKSRYPSIPLYCVGDLIDRGKFSCEVMDFVKAEGISFTPGNHDYMFYYFIKHPEHEIGRVWLYNGYETTIVSYNNRLEKMNDHLEMISAAPIFIDLQDCFICHAGISVFYKQVLPENICDNLPRLNEIVNADISSAHSILWTRDELINIGKLQVVGHTRQHEVFHLKKNNVLYIDTSVYTGNKLSAAIVDKNQLIEIISVETYDDDLSD
jgi:serine/threonine protein phosphatase 1